MNSWIVIQKITVNFWIMKLFRIFAPWFKYIILWSC